MATVRTIGSLFSGIGGLELGLERALGAKTVWQVECDPYALRVLEKHWPDVPRYTDIRTVGKELGTADLVCGGFPCQPHSVSGARKGGDDDRDLWSEFARIIGELRPRWVVAENVPGILSSRDGLGAPKGSFLGRVLFDLARLGYDAEWASVPAAALGAPHLRYRVFIVAYPSGQWGKVVADPASEHGPRAKPAGDGRGRPQTPTGHGGDVADAAGSRRPSGACREVFGPGAVERLERLCSDGGQGRETVKRMGYGFNGISSWLDGSWERGIPRVTTGEKDRVFRLRCLGNAVVPQVAEYVGRVIAAR